MLLQKRTGEAQRIKMLIAPLLGFFENFRHIIGYVTKLESTQKLFIEVK